MKFSTQWILFQAFFIYIMFWDGWLESYSNYTCALILPLFWCWCKIQRLLNRKKIIAQPIFIRQYQFNILLNIKSWYYAPLPNVQIRKPNAERVKDIYYAELSNRKDELFILLCWRTYMKQHFIMCLSDCMLFMAWFGCSICWQSPSIYSSW